MGKKYLLWASLAIVIVVAINEVFWLGKTSLAWVILGLTVAIGMLAVYFLSKEANVKIKPIYAGLLTIGILLIVIGMRLLAPAYSADEVKAIVNARFPDAAKYGVRVGYIWQGRWSVRIGEHKLIFYEDTGKFKEPEPGSPIDEAIKRFSQG